MPKFMRPKPKRSCKRISQNAPMFSIGHRDRRLPHNKTSRPLITAIGFVILFICGLPLSVSAEDTDAGTIEKIKGAVTVQRDGESLDVTTGDFIYQNDIILTAEDASLGIAFNDKSTLALGSKSKVVIIEYAYKPVKKIFPFAAKITRGSLVYLTGNIAKFGKDNVQIQTQTSVCGIRGTQFGIRVDPM